MINIFITVVIPLKYNLSINVSAYGFVNSKWVEKYPSMHSVATIYLLNEWVKDSNYKLLLPKNVDHLIKVNIYMHNV